MSKKTTLERAYLHINNGGLSFSIIERVDVRKNCTILPSDWPSQVRSLDMTSPRYSEQLEAKLAQLPKEDRHNRRWSFKIEADHFGSHTEYSFPIVPLSVKWLIAALQRVLARMETPTGLPTDNEVPYPFTDKTYVHVTAQGGQQVEEDWPVSREVCEAGSTGGRD
jgi:hypothetical protein